MSLCLLHAIHFVAVLLVMQITRGKPVTPTRGQTFYESPNDLHVVGPGTPAIRASKLSGVVGEEQTEDQGTDLGRTLGDQQGSERSARRESPPSQLLMELFVSRDFIANKPLHSGLNPRARE